MLQYKHIAIEGNIGAGKTTLAKFLAKEFNGDLLLESFEENDFLKDFYKDNNFALHAELQFVLDRSKQLFQFHTESHDLIISDYFPLKSLIFSKMNLSTKEYLMVQELIESLYQKVPKPDALIYLNRPIDELQQNILSRGREYESDISSDYLFMLNKAYEYFLENLTDIPVLRLNANEINLKNPEWLRDAFQALLSKPSQNGVKRVSL